MAWLPESTAQRHRIPVVSAPLVPVPSVPAPLALNPSVRQRQQDPSRARVHRDRGRDTDSDTHTESDSTARRDSPTSRRAESTAPEDFPKAHRVSPQRGTDVPIHHTVECIRPRPTSQPRERGRRCRRGRGWPNECVDIRSANIEDPTAHRTLPLAHTGPPVARCTGHGCTSRGEIPNSPLPANSRNRSLPWWRR